MLLKFFVLKYPDKNSFYSVLLIKTAGLHHVIHDLLHKKDNQSALDHKNHTLQALNKYFYRLLEKKQEYLQ